VVHAPTGKPVGSWYVAKLEPTGLPVGLLQNRGFSGYRYILCIKGATKGVESTFVIEAESK
jgi:hypothetical protein